MTTADGVKTFTTANVLIATGGRAWRPDIPGIEHTITSDEALDLPRAPKKIAVIGGGYIGLELACVFKGFGAEVHYYFRGETPLREFDGECRRFVTEQVEDVLGLTMHRNATPVSVAKQADGRLTYRVAVGGAEEEIGDFDEVLFATGRSPNVKNLGLEGLGIEQGPNGKIIVDEYLRTSVPNVYAVGDVIDRIQLTPVALMEGMAVAKTLFMDGGTPTKPDYDMVASAVFSQPTLASVGLSEEQAVESLGDVDVYSSSFKPMKNTLSGNPGRAMMKLVVDATTDVVVGCHMVGPDAAEILQGMAIALKMKCTKSMMDTVVGIHPSSAEEFVTMRSVSRQFRGGKLVEKA